MKKINFITLIFLVPQVLSTYVIAECLDALNPPLVLNEHKIKIERDDDRHNLLKLLGNKKVSSSVNDGKEDAILRWASYEGMLDIVILLVSSNKVDVNKRSGNSGMNPILLASFAGNSEVVEFLADVHDVHKIDLNVVDENGMTPIMWASYKGYHEIVDILLDSNVDLNITMVGLNALDLAKREGHSDIAEKIDQIMNGNGL